MLTEKDINKLAFDQGIRLDIGCGEGKKMPHWIGMDIVPNEGVDIVWDVQDIPFPIPDDSCFQILLSHMWEHIEPKFRIKVINELWRIMKHEGQLLISAPYYLSFGAHQDPTHYPCPNESTFFYFDPKYDIWQIYKPKPWKVVRCDYQMNGQLEVIMEAQKDNKYLPPKKTIDKK